MSENKKQQSNNLERRDLLKGLATVPVFGLFLAELWRKISRDAEKKIKYSFWFGPRRFSTSNYQRAFR